MSRDANTLGRKAQASMVSLALFSAVVVVGISTVVFVGQPILEDMRDAKAVDNAKDMLSGMQEQVESVAGAGEGSETVVGLRFSRGEFIFDAARDEIRYELKTDAGMIEPHSTTRIGGLQIGSMTGVTVAEDTVDGQPCWRLENDHVSACIRNIPLNATEQIGANTVGYWRFNGNGGSTAEDSSAQENDGTINGAQWSGGKHGSGLLFRSGEDYVEIPDSATGIYDIAESVTVSAWVHADSLPSGNWSPIVTKGDSQYLLQYNWGNWTFDTYNGTHHSTSTDATGDTNQWVHLVGTFDDSTGEQRLYRNGQLVDTTTGGIQSNGFSLNIGRNAQHPERVFNGTIDEVRVYNRSLSQQEVQWLYEQQGMLDYIDTQHLLLEYRNKDANRSLNASMGVALQTDQNVGFTNNGTGHTAPDIEGDGLGEGTVTAHIDSFFGIDYNVQFSLLSGADFVQVDVKED